MCDRKSHANTHNTLPESLLSDVLICLDRSDYDGADALAVLILKAQVFTASFAAVCTDYQMN